MKIDAKTYINNAQTIDVEIMQKFGMGGEGHDPLLSKVALMQNNNDIELMLSHH